MKSFIRCAFLALALVAAGSSWAGSFGGEKIVSTNANQGAQFPEVAYYNNVIHVVWVGYDPGKQGDIFYARSTSATGAFSTPVNLSNSATASVGNDRPQVTAGPNGVYVAWNSDNNTGAVYVRRSTSDGQQFVDGTASAALLVAGADGDAYYSRLTDLFTDSAGRTHVTYYTNQDTNLASGMVRHRMTCDAINWGTDSAVTSRPLEGDFDNEESRLAEGGGKFLMVFKSSRHGNPQGGWPPYSINVTSGTLSGCGIAWAYPARRVGGGIPFTYSSTYRPEIFVDGTTMHLAWWENTAGANVVYRRGPITGLLGAATKVSNFGVDHLEPGGLISTAGTAQGGFQAPPGIVSNGTTAFMTYQSHTATTGGFEHGPVYIRESGDNGATWGAEQQIATDTKAATPRIALGGTGNQNVAIVWTDVRSGLARVYYRLYTLGAVTGGPSFGLTPDPLNYGNVQVGTSTTSVMTLVNSGSAGNISGIAVAGDFGIDSQTCGATLGAGGSCTVTIRFSPAALGTRTGSITVSTDAVDSPTVVQLSGSGIANTAGGSTQFNANANAIITGYYETILGRTADAPGVSFWNGEANRVVALGADVREVFFALSIDFFKSPEYALRNTNTDQYLTDLYRTFFDRAPDQAGFDFWKSNVNSGMDRGAVLTHFLFSTEFTNKMTGLFGTQSPRPEVNVTIDLYRGILGRLPDSAGFNFWLGRVRAAQCLSSGAAAAVTTEVNNLSREFFNSPEYGAIWNSRPAAEQVPRYMGDIYNSIMRRGPDLAGYQFYVSQINTGAKTLDQVRLEFVNSPEFQGRVTAIVNAGCFGG